MRSEQKDANWWSFSIRGDERSEKIRNDQSAGTVEVTPAVDGKRLLSYHKYLGLDKLLSCQVPGSRVPDERIFIITHQLFELVFKQMIFDFGVIAETFRVLLKKGEPDFSDLAGIGGPAENDPSVEDFWRPASTAAARVRQSSRTVLPELMAYLAKDETFHNEEFEKKFRSNLWPASGFQSAQFRLIQRALGKSHLLEIRLFPSDTYLKAYQGKTEEEVAHRMLESEDAGLVSVVDRLILQEDTPIATPPAGSPLASVAELDDLAHGVLGRLGNLGRKGPVCGGAPETPLLPSDAVSVDGFEKEFKRRLIEAIERIKRRRGLPLSLTSQETASIEKRGKVFREDWIMALSLENERRKSFDGACKGAAVLFRDEDGGHLRRILGNLLDTDASFSGKFLFFHRNLVERRLGDVPGTAGGGILYLDFSMELSRLFPALAGMGEEREKAAKDHKE